METLLFEYHKNIIAGSIDEESNYLFVCKFVDEIINTPDNLREKCYCEALRDLLIFEYKQWNENKSIYSYPKYAIICIVVMLQRKGVILSEKSFNSIEKQFISAKARVVVNCVRDLLKDSWQNKSCVNENEPHITNKLCAIIGAENAPLFIEDIKKIKIKNCKHEKSLILKCLYSYSSNIPPNEHTFIAEMLKECTLINFTKVDISNYIRRNNK